jgi:hypothetical protein
MIKKRFRVYISCQVQSVPRECKNQLMKKLPESELCLYYNKTLSDTSYLFTVYSIFPYSLTHVCDSKSRLFSHCFKLQLNVCFSFNLKDILSQPQWFIHAAYDKEYISSHYVLFHCVVIPHLSASCSHFSTVFSNAFNLCSSQKGRIHISAHSKQWAKLHFHFFYFMRPGL